ncbi:MAG: hypothetical protein M0019_11070 [Actinomycetota bacterium]|nr:hypothetical protein [Actinomycetota bacterium]
MSYYDEGPEKTSDDLVSILDRLEGLIVGAKAIPLSASVMIPRDEIVYLIRLAKENLPAEMAEANWIKKEQDKYLERVQYEANEIMDEARRQAEIMVSKQEIVRRAQSYANGITVRAREEASRFRVEAENYADQKLAELEIALANIAKSVKAGRDRLSQNIVPIEIARGASDEHLRQGDDLFDGSGSFEDTRSLASRGQRSPRRQAPYDDFDEDY